MSGDQDIVLLDVEGTTTPVDFVLEVLFPYARDALHSFLDAHAEDREVAPEVAALASAHALDVAGGLNPPIWDGSMAAAASYGHWLMGRNSKLPPIKALQGMIWAEAYASGRVRGQVYEDVPRALSRWAGASRRVAIFSSGSVLAQRLLFSHTDHGDLTPFLSGYFDTTTGAKGDPMSYTRIAAALGTRPAAGLFVSDVVGELDAAFESGFSTALAVRTEPVLGDHLHRMIRSFDELP